MTLYAPYFSTRIKTLYKEQLLPGTSTPLVPTRVTAMRLSVVWLVALLASITCASNVQSYILTVDDELASPAVLDDVKSLVYDLGARITHEYSLIQGFTLDAPDELVPLLKQRLVEIETSLGYKVHLERDSQVHTFRNHDESLEKGQRL